MLSESEKEALSRPHIVEAGKVVGQYHIYLEWENGYQIIRFRISERPDSRFEFEQSHYIKTPEQASHYTTSRTHEDNVDYALHRVVGTIMDYYAEALKRGHRPNNDWFVPNRNF